MGDLHQKEVAIGEVPKPSLTLLARGISAFGYAGVALLLVSVVLTCADIVWRRVVGGAFVDTFDITKLCLVAVASLSIPYGFIHGNHVTVDLFIERFSARAQGLVDAVIHLVSAAVFVGIGWLAWKALMLHYGYHDTTQNLGIPVIYYWGIFIFGMALSFVACLWQAWHAWRRFQSHAGGVAAS